MTPLEIKHAIERAGTNQAQIARKCGVSETMVYFVLRRERRARHIEEAIAEILDVPVEDIWPEYAKKNAAA
jgi:lambda repressor-like predicted transcriptional regulator